MNKTKKLFSASNGMGRTVRTTLQAFVGILAFLAGLIAIPEVQDVLVKNNLLAAGSLATVIGVVSGVQNLVEKLLRQYFGE